MRAAALILVALFLLLSAYRAVRGDADQPMESCGTECPT